ncbi:heterokaryon incompatibility protein-domain-containing protein [Pisolithus tinctorius]|uniref:Heterokaryon incompatibility domain-containing protein n=1 Tax=Pisolithus tinctorius Marx 270 TaxID=870435 RepID=A0A0C3PIA1_PISTI|nr:heterokaryon incompatibility protein-domain-containing protein [Pisolithus tinctorius]KIO07794.1 hypothetical protein M404DRAFT_396570 [Pisolithus tinctorius Marx 270]
MDIVSCRQFDPSKLIFDKPTRNPATACLQLFSKADYTKLKQSPLFNNSFEPRTRRCRSTGDSLRSVVQSRIRSYVFANVPLRVIKLPEMRLIDRSAVVDYLIKAKLEIAVRQAEAVAQEARDETISKWVEDIARYAILSHTWEVDEPSYQDFHHPSSRGKQGYRKLENFCNIAHEDYGAEFAWADTVCIDKSSSAELDESIRSMFAWYRNAAICIAYVGQTVSLFNLAADRWFTRGWTLQELLAPLRLKFYNKDWFPLTDFRNDKISEGDVKELSDETYSFQFRLLGDAILTATGIEPRHFRDFVPGFRDPSLPERMSMLVAYGEGPERAFFRLFQAILDVECRRDWFLWTGKAVPRHIHPSRMIPSGPECYLSSNSKISPLESVPLGSFEDPLNLTNIGLSMSLLVVPARIDTQGNKYNRNHPSDLRISCPLFNDIAMVQGIPPKPTAYEFAIGIFNGSLMMLMSGSFDRVYAILLRRRGPWMNWERHETDEPLTFRLNKLQDPEGRHEAGHEAEDGVLVMYTRPDSRTKIRQYSVVVLMELALFPGLVLHICAKVGYVLQ